MSEADAGSSGSAVASGAESETDPGLREGSALKRMLPFLHRSDSLAWRLKRTASKAVHPALRAMRHRVRRIDAEVRALPDFLIIGAAKCGTSGLYRVLSSHPSVAPALMKEVHYFDVPERYRRGELWYRAHFPTRRRMAAMRKTRDRDVLTGEASPAYIFYPNVAARVAELIPDVKLVVMLRNPVDRAYSHYYHIYRPHKEILSFPEALDAEEDRIGDALEKMEEDPDFWSPPLARYAYKAGGRYAEQLARWFRFFPRDRFFIVRSEDYYQAPQAVYDEVLEFLGLSRFEPGRFRKRIYPGYPKIDSCTHTRLERYFRPHNRRLYEMLDRDMEWE